jgi:RimJ/RimL family protein N-acetyltransferase
MIERPLVRLVPVDVGLAPKLWAWRQQDAARRYMPLRQRSVEELAERLSRSASDLADRTCDEYRWFVEADAEVVGTVVLKNVSRTMGHAELGYHLAEAVHGRGIGTVAVRMCLDLAFADPDLHRIWATISADNAASQGLVRKLGFRREARLREHLRIQNHWVDQLVFAVLRHEWIVAANR